MAMILMKINGSVSITGNEDGFARGRDIRVNEIEGKDGNRDFVIHGDALHTEVSVPSDSELVFFSKYQPNCFVDCGSFHGTVVIISRGEHGSEDGQKNCGTCGKTNKADYAYCYYCGETLAETEKHKENMADINMGMSVSKVQAGQTLTEEEKSSLSQEDREDLEEIIAAMKLQKLRRDSFSK